MALRTEGSQRVNLGKGEGGSTCASEPVGIGGPYVVAAWCHSLIRSVLPFRCKFKCVQPFPEKVVGKIYWIVFLGACSSFNLPLHQSSHISSDQWRIVKLKVNRTAFAMETKVARGWIATRHWCVRKPRSSIPRVPGHRGTQKLLMIKPLLATCRRVLSLCLTQIWVTNFLAKVSQCFSI